MGATRVTISALALALVVSNSWWLYGAIDRGVTATYREVTLQEHHEALAQALAILPVVAAPGATQQEVLAAAQAAVDGPDSFEKDGFVWVGRLGLKFDSSGRLAEVETSWSPF